MVFVCANINDTAVNTRIPGDVGFGRQVVIVPFVDCLGVFSKGVIAMKSVSEEGN